MVRRLGSMVRRLGSMVRCLGSMVRCLGSGRASEQGSMARSGRASDSPEVIEFGRIALRTVLLEGREHADRVLQAGVAAVVDLGAKPA